MGYINPISAVSRQPHLFDILRVINTADSVEKGKTAFISTALIYIQGLDLWIYY